MSEKQIVQKSISINIDLMSLIEAQAALNEAISKLPKEALASANIRVGYGDEIYISWYQLETDEDVIARLEQERAEAERLEIERKQDEAAKHLEENERLIRQLQPHVEQFLKFVGESWHTTEVGTVKHSGGSVMMPDGRRAQYSLQITAHAQ